MSFCVMITTIKSLWPMKTDNAYEFTRRECITFFSDSDFRSSENFRSNFGRTFKILFSSF